VRLERYSRWALAIGLATTAVLFLAPVSNPVPTVEGIETDKLAHALLMGGLAALIWWNLRAGRWRWAASVLLAGAYAGLIELIQGALAYRSGDAVDFVAGVLGAVLFVGAAGVSMRSRTSQGSGAD
jgi:VanZ family protein